MNIEEQRNDCISKDRRTSTREQSETQRYASAENFALFILAGIVKHMENERLKTILSSDIMAMITNAANLEIMRIKYEQSLRKKTKGGM